MSGFDIKPILDTLGVKNTNQGASTGNQWISTSGEKIDSYSPVDGKHIGSVTAASVEDYNKVVDKAHEAFLKWRMVPAPARGEVVRQVSNALRKYKDELGALVSYEMGKSFQ